MEHSGFHGNGDKVVPLVRCRCAVCVLVNQCEVLHAILCSILKGDLRNRVHRPHCFRVRLVSATPVRCVVGEQNSRPRHATVAPQSDRQKQTITAYFQNTYDQATHSDLMQFCESSEFQGIRVRLQVRSEFKSAGGTINDPISGHTGDAVGGCAGI